MKVCKRATQTLIGGGLTLIVLGLGLGTGVANAQPYPEPPPPPYLPLIPDPGPIDEDGNITLFDTWGPVCNNPQVICIA